MFVITNHIIVENKDWFSCSSQKVDFSLEEQTEGFKETPDKETSLILLQRKKEKKKREIGKEEEAAFEMQVK